MKILKNNIEFFIKNFLKQDVKGILLYGQDVGVLMSREAEIRKQIPHTFELIKLNLNAENTISELFKSDSNEYLDSAIDLLAKEPKLEFKIAIRNLWNLYALDYHSD